MKLLLALALTLLACRGVADPEAPSIAGQWEGIWHNANPLHHWRLDLDAQPEGRVTGTFGITSAVMVPVHGTIEGSQRLAHVVLHASSPRGFLLRHPGHRGRGRHQNRQRN